MRASHIPWQRHRAPASTGHGADAGLLGEQSGFTLIGLMVVVALINIGLGVAVTSWMTIDKRADEAELIWRGQQYVRALQCYRQQNGAPPEELDELLEEDCIRALYPDPMTRSGQWRIIRESDLRNRGAASGGVAGRDAAGRLDAIDRELRGPEAFFGGGGRSSGARGGGLGAALGGGRGAARGAGGQQPGEMAESLRSAADRLRNLTDRLRQDISGSDDGIVGVASTSTDESLRLYEGESSYDAWWFVGR